MKNLHRTLFLVLASLLTAHAQGPTLRVVNAGSFLSDDLSPGALIAILGSNLSSNMAGTPDQLTPFTLLNGIAVNIGGVPAGIFYVSPNQITALIDPATPIGPTTLSVSGPTVNATASVNIRPVAAPGLFATSNAGDRDASALNATTYAGSPFSVTTGGQPTGVFLFGTGLDPSTAPTVTIGGAPATVQSYGPAMCCLGIEQIGVTIPAALAGAGRVEIVATAGGLASNVVEAVILPNVGQGPYPPTAENSPRNREIGAVAVVPAVGQALVVDEKDDVVRVVDVRQRAVVRTIALASGAQPFAVAVNDIGSVAVVAERGRAKVAFINLAQGVVLSEVAVDPGPSSVVLTGDTALVASSDAGTVSLLSVQQRQVLGSIPVGAAPSSIAIDPNSSLVYVANRNSGNISVIDTVRRAVVDTLQIGPNARLETVRLVPATTLLAVTEPNAGVIDFFDLPTRTLSQVQTVATDLTLTSTTAYMVNQAGATVFAMPVDMFPRSVNSNIGATVTLDPGLRSLAVDSTDRLLLVSSESSGTVSLVDMTTNRLTGTINAAPDDRGTAANLPAITSVSPRQATAGTTVQVTANGAPLAGTFAAFFALADGSVDPAFQITNVSVESTGRQITLTVQISPNAAKGDHVLRVFTPNGESTFTPLATNVMTVL